MIQAVVEEELNKIMFETISALDENESYYHGLVAGLLSPMKGYRTKSNREAGKGRSDLFVNFANLIHPTHLIRILYA